MNAATITPLRQDETRREVYPILPEDRRLAVEQGIAIYQRVAADLEVVRAELDGQRQANKLLEMELDELRQRVKQADARTYAAEADRDEARTARAELEVFFSSMAAMMDRFAVQPKPLRARKPPVVAAPTSSDT